MSTDVKWYFIFLSVVCFGVVIGKTAENYFHTEELKACYEAAKVNKDIVCQKS